MGRSKCSKELYRAFLQITSERYTANALSEVSPIELSHDSVSRWLAESNCRPKDVWEASKSKVNGNGILIADETVINKSRSKKIELVRWQYSGNEHDIIKGIGLLNIYWASDTENSTPIDFRIYQPTDDGKTKNDHFRELMSLAKKRGVEPEAVVADSWYSSLDNVKHIRDLGWSWVMGLRKNRIVNKGDRLDSLAIPENGLRVHLRGYGWITVFRFVTKHGRTDYIGTNIENPTLEQVIDFVKRRWAIEVFHRELKQTCGLECCQARTGRAQRNHIGLAILTWINQAKLRNQLSCSFYQLKWDVIKDAISYRLRLELAMT
jgi:hypothetical protein